MASPIRCSAPMRASSFGAPLGFRADPARCGWRRPATLREALSFFDAMKALHSASWERRGKPHAFIGGFFEPFHRLLIERSFSDRRDPASSSVSAGDLVIGYLYNFPSRRSHLCLPERVRRTTNGAARPGAVAHALAIREAFRSGARDL